MTEMTHLRLISFQPTFVYNTRDSNSGRLGKFIVYVAFSQFIFGARNSFQTYMIKNEN